MSEVGGSPANIEAEQLILAACLMFPATFPEALDSLEGLEPKHFSEGLHVQIYEAVVAARAQGVTPSVVSIGQALSDIQTTEGSFAIRPYLARLATSAPPPAMIRSYVEMLIELWRRREIVRAADAIREEALKADLGQRAESAMSVARERLAGLESSIAVTGRSVLGGAFLHELSRERKARDWLLKGVLTANTFSLVIGAPGCGKSFLMLDFAMTVALAAVRKADAMWFGRRVKPCGVVYIYAEGREDFELRIEAFLLAQRIEREEFPFYLVPTAVDLCSSTEGRDKLIADIKAANSACEKAFGVNFGICIVDTVNRALGGMDENSSQTMGTFVRNCGTIKEQCGVSLIGVHHTPAASEKARGHGALHGATDAEIIVTGPSEGKPNRWRVSRCKVGPTGAWHEFRLRQQILGKDADGDDETSCVVMPLGGEASLEGANAYDAALTAKTRSPHMTPDGRAILRENLFLAFKALCTAIAERGTVAPVGVRAPHGAAAVTFSDWIDEIVRLFPGDDKTSETFRKRCSKARERAAAMLMRRDIIGMDQNHVWRTSRLVLGVDKPSLNGENMSRDGDDASLDRTKASPKVTYAQHLDMEATF